MLRPPPILYSTAHSQFKYHLFLQSMKIEGNRAISVLSTQFNYALRIIFWINLYKENVATHEILILSIYLSIYLSFSSIYLFIQDLHLSGCSPIDSTQVDLVISWNFSQWHPDEFIYIHYLCKLFLKVLLFFSHCFNSTYTKNHLFANIWNLSKTSLSLYFIVYDNSKLLGMYKYIGLRAQQVNDI